MPLHKLPLIVAFNVQKSMELVYATSHKLPLIMTFNVQKFNFYTHIFKKSPYRGRGNSHTLPCSVASLPRIGPSFTNPVYTAVTSITKASLKGPCPLHPPLIGVNELKKGGIRELVYAMYVTSYILPLIMTFNMQNGPF